jgi:hypothetical protein
MHHQEDIPYYSTDVEDATQYRRRRNTAKTPIN